MICKPQVQALSTEATFADHQTEVLAQEHPHFDMMSHCTRRRFQAIAIRPFHLLCSVALSCPRVMQSLCSWINSVRCLAWWFAFASPKDWTPDPKILKVLKVVNGFWEGSPVMARREDRKQATGMWWPCLSGGLDQMTSRGPFQAKTFCDLLTEEGDSLVHRGYLCRSNLRFIPWLWGQLPSLDNSQVINLLSLQKIRQVASALPFGNIPLHGICLDRTGCCKPKACPVPFK